MATSTSTKALALTAEEIDGVDVAQSTMTGTLEALRKAYAKAHKDETDAKAAMESAEVARYSAMVWQARVAYRAMTHPDVATARYKENITGAAKVLGIPVATLRPYGLAGMALHKADRAGLLSLPDGEDIKLLNDSFDATSRQDQKEKRLREKAKKEALEAKARELEALKQANGDKAPEGLKDVVDAADAILDAAKAPKAPAPAPATDKAPEAPAKAPEAQSGPSLQDDAVTVAKDLVRKLKALKAGGDKATILKVNAILGDFYPALKA